MLLTWKGPGRFGAHAPGDSFEASDELAARWLRDFPGKITAASEGGAEPPAGSESGPSAGTPAAPNPPLTEDPAPRAKFRRGRRKFDKGE